MVVLATRSGRYDRAEDLFGLLLAVIAVAVAWVTWQDLEPNTDDWALGHSPVLGLGAVLAMFVLWAFFGAALATRFPALARPFIPRAQIEAEVRRRGFEAFHLFRVGHTTGHTGMLLFVSLLERTAWVVGDDAISAKLPQSTWDDACSAIAQGFRRGEHEKGLVEAISLCGKALAEGFPRRPTDAINELPNTVQVMD